MARDPRRHTEILHHRLDTAPFQEWSVDQDLKLTYLRGAIIEDVLEGSLQEYLGRPLTALLPPDSAWVLDRHRAALGGEPQSYEVQWRDRVMWVHLQPPGEDGEEVAGIAVEVAPQATIRERLEHLFENLGQGVVYQAPNGDITDANPAAQEILGLTLDQMTGRTSMDPEWEAVREDGTPLPGDEHPAMAALREKRVVPGVIMGVNNPRTGHHRWIRVTGVPRLGPDGDPMEVFTSFEDITELWEAEETLKRSRELLLETGEMLRVGGWEVDPETGRVHWSEVTRTLHGVDEDYDPSLEDAYAFFPGEARDRIAEAVRRAIEEGVPYDMELPFVTAGGEELWVHTVGKTELEDGRCVRLHGTFQDITEHKERERELERLNRALSFVSASNAALVRGSPDVDLLQRICDVAIERGGYAHVWIAYREDESDPLQLFQAGHEHAIDLLSFEGLREEVDAVAAAGLALVARGLGSGGSPWEERLAEEGLEALVVLPFPAESQVEGFIALAHTDPEALTSAEVEVLGDLVADLAYGLWVRSIRQELMLIQKAVANLSVGVSILDVTDPALPFVYVNEGFTQVTGYSAAEVLGRHCDVLLGPDTDPDASAEIEAAFREGRATQLTVLNFRKSGEPFWNRLTLEPIRDEQGRLTHFVVIQEDVTEERQVRLELEHRSRLSAVGELAGGVAHDFRNILTASQGLLQLSLGEAELGEDARENLRELERLVDRGTAVTERLLMLSRRGDGDLEPVALMPLLDEAVTLVGHTIRDDIAVEADHGDSSVAVVLDRDQFTTVVLNLARNAAQAMPHGGTLTVETVYPIVPRGPRWWPQDLRPEGDSPWVRVTVRDTGTGMDPETLEQAFDPYFTSKPSGEGTGLGLSMVHGVVERIGGRAWIESQPGQGTAVHILLPTVDAVAEPTDEAPSQAAVAAAARSAERTGTILLAEDDSTVLLVFRKALERAGHKVLAGADGVEALEQFQSGTAEVDLVITDGFMPRMSGAELSRAVWESRPDLTVVVTSGFGSDDIRQEFPKIPSGRLVFLPKPLSIDDLLAAVQELLSPSEPGAP